MKTYLVTYIDPFIDANTLQSDIWTADLLITECGKGEVTILSVYDAEQNIEFAWEN